MEHEQLFPKGVTVGNLLELLKTLPPETKVMRHDGQAWNQARIIHYDAYAKKPAGYRQISVYEKRNNMANIEFKGISL
jgi:hypothetical protein